MKTKNFSRIATCISVYLFTPLLFGDIPSAWKAGHAPPGAADLRAITYANRQFVAVGRNYTIATSPNGIDWMLRTNDTESSTFNAIVSAKSIYVAGGQIGAFRALSSDGITWNNGQATLGIETINGLTFANGVFVGVGHGLHEDTAAYILTSPDGTNWQTRRPFTTNELHAVTYGTNAFVAVGDRGTILSSPDGTNWTLHPSPTSVSLRAVTFNGSRFVAGGDIGRVVSSPNGANWSSAAPASFNIKGLVSGDGAVVAVGDDGLGGGRLHPSPDGLTWPGYSLEFSNALRAVAYRPDHFVTVGDNGIILWSNGATEGETNSWTKATDGNWEDLFWSRPELPWIGQSAIVFSNAGSKVLTIRTNTAVNYPSSLFIPNLTVTAPTGSINQLFLDHAGLDVPLTIRDNFVLGPNASLLAYHSAFNASSSDLSGAATFSEGSIASFSTLSLGVNAPGELNNVNSSVSAGRLSISELAPGTVNQSGGTTEISGLLWMKNQSAYNITNGSLKAGSIELATQGLTGPAVINARDAVIEVGDGGLGLGSTPSGGNPGRGHGDFTLTGGSFQAPTVNFHDGSISLINATSHISTIHLPFVLASSGLGSFLLSGGSLESQSIVLGSSDAGRGAFVQNGGAHTNTSGVTLNGSNRKGGHASLGSYTLNDGFLITPALEVQGGAFAQSGGTNWATARVTVSAVGRFTLSGGTLNSSAFTVDGALDSGQRSRFIQTGGTHTAWGVSIDHSAVYEVWGGTLITPHIDVDRNAQLWLLGGTISNAGGLELMDGGTVFVASAQEINFGRLFFTGSTTLDFQNSGSVVRFWDCSQLQWPDGPHVLSIRNWSGSTNGRGENQIFFGTTAAGLQIYQLRHVQFINPSGFPAGTYPARILTNGEVVPAPQPSIQFTPARTYMILSWPSGYDLLTATNVAGPYSVMSGASGVYSNAFNEPQRFFQLRSW